ncbi:MAG: hypothetical protein K6A42_06040 [Treponema sp.]|nr:hypothetical protein [Treponema sp.]
MGANKKESGKEYSSNWGGRRPGQGRPKGATSVSKESEKTELERRAKEAGTTVSKFIHSLLFSEKN